MTNIKFSTWPVIYRIIVYVVIGWLLLLSFYTWLVPEFFPSLTWFFLFAIPLIVLALMIVKPEAAKIFLFITGTLFFFGTCGYIGYYHAIPFLSDIGSPAERLHGKITKVFNYCLFDGICGIEVDNHCQVMIEQGGYSYPPRRIIRGRVSGISFTALNVDEYIGRSVNVYAKKIDNDYLHSWSGKPTNCSLSIYDSTRYYVSVNKN